MTDIPVTHHWLAGEDMNADRMNEVAAAIEFLRNPPMIHVRRRLTAQSLTGSVWNKISFDQVVNSYDPTGMFDAGTPDRVTAQVPGWYSYEARISVVGTATTTRVILGTYRNGFSSDQHILRADMENAPSAGNINIRRDSTIFLNAGDWLHLAFFADNAETRTTSTFSDAESSGLRVRWVSK